MSGYEIFLGIFQVVVVGSMFYVLKKYGRLGLMKFGGALLAIIALVTLLVFSSDNKKRPVSLEKLEVKKEQTLKEQFEKYVPKDEFTEKIYKRCQELGDECRKFYIGYFLFKNTTKTELSLEYLLESYENNISQVLKDETEASNYYLTDTIARLYGRVGNSEKEIEFLKLSIDAGNNMNLCFLGRAYDKKDMLKPAYKAFKEGADKGFYKCFTDLGMYYFNGRYVEKNRELGGEYWKKAYRDSEFGLVENFNMGVYYGYKNEDRKYKFHMLKAAKMGDKEAIWYVGSSHLKGLSVTELFLQEVICTDCYYSDVTGNRFAYGTTLFYRLKTMYNHNKKWEVDYDNNQEHTERFINGRSSLLLGLKKVQLKSTLNSLSREKSVENDVKLLYELIFADLSKAQKVISLHNELILKLKNNQDFEYRKNFKVLGYEFIWYGKYDNQSKELVVEIGVV